MNVNFRREVLPKGGAQKLTIIPLEVHWSRRTRSNGFCASTFTKVLKRIEQDPLCRVVIVGDLTDADRPTSRERKLLMGLGRPEVLAEDDLNHMDELRTHLIPKLKPIESKIIGAVDGDHFRIFSTGMTSTKFIMTELGVPEAYLGERMGWVRLLVNKSGKGGSTCTFDIFVRHGKGQAGNFGTDVNALVRQNTGFDADLYIGGHTHRQWFVKIPYLYCGKSHIRQRYVGYARAGSLLRGFLYGETTYPEVCEYSPLSIGWPEIFVTFGFCYAECRGTLKVIEMQGLT